MDRPSIADPSQAEEWERAVELRVDGLSERLDWVVLSDRASQLSEFVKTRATRFPRSREHAVNIVDTLGDGIALAISLLPKIRAERNEELLFRDFAKQILVLEDVYEKSE
jgi:hypothetical protein